jgi:hypothetical protein
LTVRVHILLLGTNQQENTINCISVVGCYVLPQNTIPLNYNGLKRGRGIKYAFLDGSFPIILYVISFSGGLGRAVSNDKFFSSFTSSVILNAPLPSELNYFAFGQPLILPMGRRLPRNQNSGYSSSLELLENLAGYNL